MGQGLILVFKSLTQFQICSLNIPDFQGRQVTVACLLSIIGVIFELANCEQLCTLLLECNN